MSELAVSQIVAPWWASESLVPSSDALRMDGHALADVYRAHGGPTAVFAYSAPTLRRNLAAVQGALDEAGVSSRIQYAMKSNRDRAVLGVLREVNAGLDACSPREVQYAIEAGFQPQDVTFNAGMLSEHDLDVVVGTGVPVILDSFSSLRRFGARVPKGTRIGVRFDPAVETGYKAKTVLAYGNSKFGFEPGQMADVLAAAAAAGLVVEGVHMHLGWGLGEHVRDEVAQAYGRLAWLGRQVPGLRWVNVGGGLGARYRATDRPLSLATWSATIREHLAPLGVTVMCEPGTVVVGNSGVLLVEVNTVERRRGITWVGVNAGHPLNPCTALYGIPIEIAHATRPLDAPVGTFSVVGHINEAGDVWSAEAALPRVEEGDVLALLPAGAYASSMSSDHCLRGAHRSVLLGA